MSSNKILKFIFIFWSSIAKIILVKIFLSCLELAEKFVQFQHQNNVPFHTHTRTLAQLNSNWLDPIQMNWLDNFLIATNWSRFSEIIDSAIPSRQCDNYSQQSGIEMPSDRCIVRHRTQWSQIGIRRKYKYSRHASVISSPVMFHSMHPSPSFPHPSP